MDFLDPTKRFEQTVLLITGYVLIGIGIIIATVILLYQAYGFGLGKNGTVIQNGLLFFSSQPNPASIYIDGKLNKAKTNARIVLPAASYQVKLTRPGYRTWQRTVVLQGGKVEHFDYPLLFPTKLITKKLFAYPSAPGLVTQSPNQRWLLVEDSATSSTFDMYDLTNPTKAAVPITVPSSVVTHASTVESYSVVGWSDDDQHVLLEHSYDGSAEYILFDRTDPSQSLNLSQQLSGDSFTQISFDNKKYDQYFLYNAANQTLDSASLGNHPEVPVATHVVAYQTYGTNTVLYVTSDGAVAGKVVVKELVGDQNYVIRSLPDNTSYVLDLTDYSGVPYVAVGAASENKVYVYDDPIGQLGSLPSPIPDQVLDVPLPNYLSFSPNAQFIVAENGQNFGVYDIENAHGYSYTTTQTLDAPQTHASWMDGDRLTYISAGKVIVFDYDHANVQSLVAANPNYLPFFDPNYKYLFTLAASPTSANTETDLAETSLYIPADQ
jgi:hypothetical protein